MPWLWKRYLKEVPFPCLSVVQRYHFPEPLTKIKNCTLLVLASGIFVRTLVSEEKLSWSWEGHQPLYCLLLMISVGRIVTSPLLPVPTCHTTCWIRPTDTGGNCKLTSRCIFLLSYDPGILMPIDRVNEVRTDYWLTQFKWHVETFVSNTCASCSFFNRGLSASSSGSIMHERTTLISRAAQRTVVDNQRNF